MLAGAAARPARDAAERAAALDGLGAALGAAAGDDARKLRAAVAEREREKRGFYYFIFLGVFIRILFLDFPVMSSFLDFFNNVELWIFPSML